MKTKLTKFIKRLKSTLSTLTPRIYHYSDTTVLYWLGYELIVANNKRRL